MLGKVNRMIPRNYTTIIEGNQYITKGNCSFYNITLSLSDAKMKMHENPLYCKSTLFAVCVSSRVLFDPVQLIWSPVVSSEVYPPMMTDRAGWLPIHLTHSCSNIPFLYVHLFKPKFLAIVHDKYNFSGLEQCNSFCFISPFFGILKPRINTYKYKLV